MAVRCSPFLLNRRGASSERPGVVKAAPGAPGGLGLYSEDRFEMIGLEERAGGDYEMEHGQIARRMDVGEDGVNKLVGHR